MATGSRVEVGLPTAAATLGAVAMVAQQVGGKAARDALFLSNYPATALPRAMVAAAALSLLGVLLTSRALARFGPFRVVPVVFTASGALFVAEYFLIRAMPHVGVVSLYLHAAVFGAIVISGFWSVVNERFDPHTAKRVIGRIAAGATLGGVLGGVAAERVASMTRPEMMLFVLAGLNLVAALCVSRIRAPAQHKADTDVAPLAVQVMARTPYLRNLALLVTFVAMTSALVDYTFKAEAAAAIESSERLMRFFAAFYTATGVLTFLLQTSLTKPALKRLGLAGTIATLPIVVLAAGAMSAVFTRLWTVVLVRGVESILSNSLFRSGYELLYTPVSPAKKRPTKALIDVGFDRLGDVVGAGLIMLLLAVMPTGLHQVLLGVAVGGAALALVVALRLHRGYIAQLAESLKSGSVELDESDVLDATTKAALAETAIAVDRDKLLAEIAKVRRAGEETALAGADSVRSEAARTTSRPPDADHLLGDVRDLLSGDTNRNIRVLQKRPVDTRLVTHMIPLLAQDVAVQHARRSLRDIAPKVLGQLIDALLDPSTPFVVRRRLPGVIEACDGQRAAAGLFAALSDDRFEVRYRAGQALSHLCERDPDIVFKRREVFASAERELDVNEKVWEDYRALEEEPEEISPLLDDVLRDRMHRSLQHVFTILSLCLDRDVLQLSLRALYSDDAALRGTALEYLDNVLVPSIRKRLWTRLGEARPESKSPRSHDQIIDDLFKSSDSMQIDVTKLRKTLRST